MPADRTQKPCILVVEEEEAIRDLLKMGLEARGFAILPASGGREAIELYRHIGEEIAVALIDVRISGLGGPETLAALRELAPDLPCCFMTGGDVGGKLEELSVTCVFPKPFSLDDVADKLSRVVSGSRPEEPQGGTEVCEP